jgi:amphiphysin
MQNNMKLIRRTITKREHKLVDYDRYRLSLKKLNDKKERTLSDEKQIFKVRALHAFSSSFYSTLAYASAHTHNMQAFAFI